MSSPLNGGPGAGAGSRLSGDNDANLNPVEQFEKAFQACLSVVTKEDTLTNTDHDEVRVDAEIAIQELMDKARGMEGYFLKKRLHIAHLKPELVLKDDTMELRLELMRKDELLKKNWEKISHWQNILSDVQSNTTIGGLGNKPPGSVPGPGPGIPMGPMSGPGGPGSQGPYQQQGPGSVGRPQTPASVGPPGGPGTPGQQGPPMTPMQMSMSSPHPPGGGPGSRPLTSFAGQINPQGGPPGGGGGGLQGPLAFLEKTASTIGASGGAASSGDPRGAASRRGRPKKQMSSFDPITGQPIPSPSPSSQDPPKPKRIYRRKSKPGDIESSVTTPTESMMPNTPSSVGSTLGSPGFFME